MIRTVNQDVAVETGSRRQLRSRGGRAGLLGAVGSRDTRAGQIRTAVDLGAVVATMAVLAEPGDSRLELCRVAGSVGRMAIRAIVRHRRVLPQIRTALFRVAGKAGVVDRVLDEQFRTRRAALMVTLRTCHLPRVGQPRGGEWMSGDATHLRALRLVAPEADIGLCRLAQHLLVRRVNVVTIRARHATTLVLTAGPIRPRKHLG